MIGILCIFGTFVSTLLAFLEPLCGNFGGLFTFLYPTTLLLKFLVIGWDTFAVGIGTSIVVA